MAYARGGGGGLLQLLLCLWLCNAVSRPPRKEYVVLKTGKDASESAHFRAGDSAAKERMAWVGSGVDKHTEVTEDAESAENTAHMPALVMMREV